MKWFWPVVLTSGICFAQPAKVTLANACCLSISQLRFTVSGAAQSISLDYGFVSSPFEVAAGQSSLQVFAPGSGAALYTSGQFTLGSGKEYWLVFSGVVGTYQLIGPIEDSTVGDVNKIRLRVALSAPYILQGGANPEIHLRVLCPSTGSPLFDITAVDRNFSPSPPNYAEVATQVQETCRVQTVQVASGTSTTVMDSSYFLSKGNNYTFLLVGQDAASLKQILVVDSR